jgi:predicted aminopeptidase
MVTETCAVTARHPCEPDQPQVARWRLALAGLFACSALSGCAIGYMAQAAHGEWSVLQAREPIDRIVADPHAKPDLKARLKLVQEARAFAVTALDLPDNRSYRTYADIHRPYVVWNVVAAPEFSVKPLHWCFPITGCVDYRGYFKERKARAFAARLAARGNDVSVDGVPAYSTLGHFADPVLSTMLDYDDLDLVGTIFHELAHQLLYVAGDSEFDESFAMSVQDEGVRRWLAAHGRSAELDHYLQQQRLELQIVQRLTAGRRELKQLYAAPLPLEQRRVRKQELMASLVRQVREIEQRQGMRTGYDDWIDQGLNNARLASVGTYFDCVPGFESLLARNGGDLPAFYTAVRALSRQTQARRALCRVAPSARQASGGGAG